MSQAWAGGDWPTEESDHNTLELLRAASEKTKQY